AAEVQGRGHSRSGRVPGDIEVDTEVGRPCQGRRARSERHMKRIPTLIALGAVALPIALLAQRTDPARAATYPDAWPAHYGDHSGRRYSPLAQINATNVKTLSLAWIHRATAQEGDNVGGEYRTGDPYYWGGPQANVTIKAT